jgi:hypothetical protein
MEISANIQGLNAADPVRQQVSVAMLRNGLDIQKEQAAMLLKMMQESGLGQNVNLFA